jgi:alpha-glucosidase
MISHAIDKNHAHGYNFLEVTGEEDYYQIQTSKVKCYSKADMRVSILIYTELFYLKMNWVSIGKKVTNMVISLK